MGYLVKHWRGELSLAVSFWVNFVLVNALLGIAEFLNSTGQFTDNPVVINRIALFVQAGQLLVIFPWQFVGLWRAGTHRAQRTGRHVASVLVKVLMVLMLALHVTAVYYRRGMYRELYKIVFMKDDIPGCYFSLKADNTVLCLEGGLPFGTSGRFGSILAAHPEIETILLDCTGGRLYEARKMAEQIMQRGLDTATARGCYSAGNLVYAAGQRRMLCDGAVLGFHEYYYPEPFRGHVDIQAEYKRDWDFYMLRGVTRQFHAKLFSAEPNDFWFPSEEELLEGGMVHEVVTLKELLPMEEAIVYGFGVRHSSDATSEKPEAVTADEVKGWILACSGVLWERNRDGFESLEAWGDPDVKARYWKEALADGWDIHNRDDLLRDLFWLTQEGGHRDNFARDGEWVSMMTMEELEKFLEPYEEYEEKCNDLRVAHQYYETLGDNGILAWDLSRYMCVCRWGYICGWLDEKTAWELMLPVARELQQRFDSWEAMGQNYLIGRQYWSVKHVREEKADYDDGLARLKEMPSSPWNRYPWEMGLSEAEGLISDSLGGDSEVVSAVFEAAEPAVVTELEIPAELQAMPVVATPVITEPNLFAVNDLSVLRENGTVRVVPEEYSTIQSAVEAAGEGDTIYIQKGVYTEKIIIDQKKDLHIVGQSAADVVLYPESSDQNEVIRIRSSGPIFLSDVTIEDRRTDGEWRKSGVCISNSTFEITGCRIICQCGNGIQIFGSGTGTVRRTLIESCDFDGVRVSEKNELTIADSCIRDNRGLGVHCFNRTTLAVRDTLIEKNSSGIYLTGQGTESTVFGCVIRDHNSRGIILSDGARLSVEKSMITSNGNAGIHVVDKQTHIEFVRSRLCLNQFSGLFVDKGASASIENSIFENNQQDGITLRGSETTADMTGVWCHDNNKSGIGVEEHSFTAVNNSNIHRNEKGGVFFRDNGSGSIEHSVFEKNKLSGIIANGNDSRITIKHVYSIENEQAGIYVFNGAFADIQESVCSGNKHSGILVHAKNTKAHIVNNRCSLNGSSGIRIYDGAQADVLENVCADNEHNGIQVYHNGAVAELKNNRCFSNLYNGISFSDSASGTIMDCHCLNNGRYGIALWGGAVVTVENCRSDENHYSGIYVSEEGSRAELVNNQCTLNGCNGIMVTDGAGPVTLTGNTCAGNYPSGISLKECIAGSVSNNRCRENPWAGIAVRGAQTSPMLSGNDFSANGTWGIRIGDGAAPVVEDNILEDNAKGMVFVEK